MTIRWSPPALVALLNMPRADAQVIDRAVQDWAACGEGMVVFVEGEFRLFVGAHRVALLVDGDTVHVDRVRRA